VTATYLAILFKEAQFNQALTLSVAKQRLIPIISLAMELRQMWVI
jgi:hypothetical protein